MVGSMTAELVRQRLLRLCAAGLDLSSFRSEVMSLLRRTIPADAWCIGTVDPATLMLTSSIGEGFPMQGSGRFLEIEYGEKDYNKFSELARQVPPVGLLSAATRGRLRDSPRWCEFCAPVGLGDELRAALVVDGVCWGVLDLARRPEGGDFTDLEAAYVASLVAPIAVGLRASLIADRPVIEDAAGGPGLLTLSDDLTLQAMSAPAAQWLPYLRDLESAWMGPLPNVVYTVAARLRQLEAAEEAQASVMPRARVQIRDGRWLAVQASRLFTPAGAGHIAVVIEPASSPEIAPLIASAYSLTRREAEVAGLVLRGLSTKEIAARLRISPLTVQQHLKLVFEKVGVRTRRELVSRVFEQQYRPRLKAGAKVGADGWFA